MLVEVPATGHFAEGNPRPLGDPQIDRRIPLDLLLLRQQEDLDAGPAVDEVPGHHQSIAAVIPLPAHHHHPRPVQSREVLFHHADGSGPGILHEDAGRDTVLRLSPAIQLLYLFGGNDLHNQQLEC